MAVSMSTGMQDESQTTEKVEVSWMNSHQIDNQPSKEAFILSAVFADGSVIGLITGRSGLISR